MQQTSSVERCECCAHTNTSPKSSDIAVVSHLGWSAKDGLAKEGEDGALCTLETLANSESALVREQAVLAMKRLEGKVNDVLPKLAFVRTSFPTSLCLHSSDPLVTACCALFHVLVFLRQNQIDHVLYRMLHD
jgi:hypothetical protein